MIEVINWEKEDDKESVGSWFIVEGMSAVPGGISTFGEFDSSKLEVELKINGVNVPFLKVMESLNSQLNNISQQGKVQGKKEMLEHFQDSLDNLRERLDE